MCILFAVVMLLLFTILWYLCMLRQYFHKKEYNKVVLSWRKLYFFFLLVSTDISRLLLNILALNYHLYLIGFTSWVKKFVRCTAFGCYISLSQFCLFLQIKGFTYLICPLWSIWPYILMQKWSYVQWIYYSDHKNVLSSQYNKVMYRWNQAFKYSPTIFNQWNCVLCLFKQICVFGTGIRPRRSLLDIHLTITYNIYTPTGLFIFFFFFFYECISKKPFVFPRWKSRSF